MRRLLTGLVFLAAAIPAVALSAVPAAAAPAGGLPTTLAAAQAQWPGAQLSPDGTMAHPGRYIIRLHDGRYTVMGMEVRNLRVQPIQGTGGVTPSACYYIKQEVYTYEYIQLGYITFDTWNHTNNSCGSQAWGDTETPGCIGLLVCGSILGMGWIGQGTYTVNAWLNEQTWSYTAYCRTYFQANGNYWAWCSP